MVMARDVTFLQRFLGCRYSLRHLLKISQVSGDVMMRRWGVVKEASLDYLP